jgi:hypothetical protein
MTDEFEELLGAVRDRESLERFISLVCRGRSSDFSQGLKAGFVIFFKLIKPVNEDIEAQIKLLRELVSKGIIGTN